MLARDQIKSVAQEIERTADGRIHDGDDRLGRQQLWEVVRRASHIIRAVAEMESSELGPGERVRRTRFVISELDAALEAANRARVIQAWTVHREPDVG